MEVVVHFLLTMLDRSAAAEAFKSVALASHHCASHHWPPFRAALACSDSPLSCRFCTQILLANHGPPAGKGVSQRGRRLVEAHRRGSQRCVSGHVRHRAPTPLTLLRPPRVAQTVPSSGINKLAPAILLSPQGATPPRRRCARPPARSQRRPPPHVGHKIYRLLLRLSNHVLRVRMQEHYDTPAERYFEAFDSSAVPPQYLPVGAPGRPARRDPFRRGAHPSNYFVRSMPQVAAHALEAQSRTLCDRFIRQAQQQVNLQQRWRSYAATLTRAYRSAPPRVPPLSVPVSSWFSHRRCSNPCS